MFDNIIKFFKNISKNEKKDSKETAKDRLQLVLMQDRANVSADFLELMKQEIIDVIKKYIDVDENEIDVRLTNKPNGDGTTGAPALFANIPIISIKEESKKIVADTDKEKQEEVKKEENKEVSEKNSEDKVEENEQDESKLEENQEEVEEKKNENEEEEIVEEKENKEEMENSEEQIKEKETKEKTGEQDKIEA